MLVQDPCRPEVRQKYLGRCRRDLHYVIGRDVELAHHVGKFESVAWWIKLLNWRVTDSKLYYAIGGGGLFHGLVRPSPLTPSNSLHMDFLITCIVF